MLAKYKNISIDANKYIERWPHSCKIAWTTLLWVGFPCSMKMLFWIARFQRSQVILTEIGRSCSPIVVYILNYSKSWIFWSDQYSLPNQFFQTKCYCHVNCFCSIRLICNFFLRGRPNFLKCFVVHMSHKPCFWSICGYGNICSAFFAEFNHHSKFEIQYLKFEIRNSILRLTIESKDNKLMFFLGNYMRFSKLLHE